METQHFAKITLVSPSNNVILSTDYPNRTCGSAFCNGIDFVVFRQTKNFKSCTVRDEGVCIHVSRMKYIIYLFSCTLEVLIFALITSVKT
jgi:hypothetical protein